MNDLTPDFLSILDEIPLGICLIDKQREILFINQSLEALTGFSRIQCKGLPCSHILRFNKCFENCPVAKSGTRERCVMEGNIINQDHQKVPVRVSFSPVMDRSGNISAYMETVEDLRRTRDFDPVRIHPFSFGRIIGRSEQMEKIFQILPVIAQSEAPVLITGQTGTGKDLLAEAIHHASPRVKAPLVTFRCGALPEPFAESELFGLEKGAFPGTEKKAGKFRLAQNGTLFLAEVCDLPPSLQAKLLNYLYERIIYPVGMGRGAPVDVRIIAASSRNLDQMVKKGAFLKELYFRLNAVSLHLPPLKDRDGDLRLLMDHFLHARASLLNKTITGFSDTCLRKLEEYAYPGNVLELRHIVEYAANLCQGGRISVRDLPAYMTRNFEDLDRGMLPGAKQPPSREEDAGGILEWSGLERKMIVSALVKANGRRNKAAEMLGWGRSTLWRKMKQHGITSGTGIGHE